MGIFGVLLRFLPCLLERIESAVENMALRHQLDSPLMLCANFDAHELLQSLLRQFEQILRASQVASFQAPAEPP